MKGSVLVIGSLLWENETNSLNKNQGKLREKWRKDLDFENKIAVKVPIRYGRKSGSRICTYTIIFSNSVKSLGTAFIVPYKEETNSFEKIRQQAIELSKAEGISKKSSDNLIASWGAVGIAFNKNKGGIYAKLKKNWRKKFKTFKNKDYRIGSESPSIKENGELNFEFEIPNTIDYVFATPVKPNIAEYPNNEKIIEAILESNPRYDTYVIENYQNGIRIENDDELIEGLK